MKFEMRRAIGDCRDLFCRRKRQRRLVIAWTLVDSVAETSALSIAPAEGFAASARVSVRVG